MERKEFVGLVASGALTLSLLSLIEACSKSAVGVTGVDFNLDLTQTANEALTQPGGYVVSNNVIIINTGSGYVALSDICTHAGCAVLYDSSTKTLPCPCHGSLFNINGTVLRGPAVTSLHKYAVAQSGNTLHVTG